VRLVAALLAVKVPFPVAARRGSPLPSFGAKALHAAQASISVPSTEKCSSDSSALTRSWFSIAAMNCAAMSPAISRRGRADLLHHPFNEVMEDAKFAVEGFDELLIGLNPHDRFWQHVMPA
jgi:hypothetical protein